MSENATRSPTVNNTFYSDFWNLTIKLLIGFLIRMIAKLDLIRFDNSMWKLIKEITDAQQEPWRL